jgi:hypothetical protein
MTDIQVTVWRFKKYVVDSGFYDKKITHLDWCERKMSELNKSDDDFEYYLKEKNGSQSSNRGKNKYTYKMVAIFKKERAER